jgi:hypothetical protein
MPMHVTGHAKSLFTSMCATYESAGGLNMGGTPDSAHDHHNELLPVPLASGHSVDTPLNGTGYNLASLFTG